MPQPGDQVAIMPQDSAKTSTTDDNNVPVLTLVTDGQSEPYNIAAAAAAAQVHEYADASDDLDYSYLEFDDFSWPSDW